MRYFTRKGKKTDIFQIFLFFYPFVTKKVKATLLLRRT